MNINITASFISSILSSIKVDKDKFYVVYYGDGFTGIKSACNGYFNKHPKDLTKDDKKNPSRTKD